MGNNLGPLGGFEDEFPIKIVFAKAQVIDLVDLRANRYGGRVSAPGDGFGEMVLMTLLGGLGTVLGPVVGALTVVTLQNELVDKVGSWVTVIMGGIFVVYVLAFRHGMVGEAQALLHRML